MSITSSRFSLAAGAAALIMVVAQAAPASACDVLSATDITCPGANLNPANPTSLLNPANPLSPQNPGNPANPSSPFSINNPANPNSPFNPANQPSYGYGAAPVDGAGGLLGALLGADQPASVVTPGDGYEPEDTRILRHRHHHRRMRHAE